MRVEAEMEKDSCPECKALCEEIERLRAIVPRKLPRILT